MKASRRQAVETKRAKRTAAIIPAADRQPRATAAGRAGIARSAGQATSATHGATPTHAHGAAPAATAALSLGPDGLRLEPSPTEATRALDISVGWDDLTDAERIERLNHEILRYGEALASERASLARLADIWREYDELTRGEWHCSRATAIRAQMRALLRSER